MSLDINTLFASFPSGLAQGLLWGIMALGLYITFRMLNFAKKETITASHGFHPPIINITATAPPVVNVPSTVISAKFNIRNVM